MKLLVDTAAFLWIIAGGGKLSAAARDAVADLDNELYLSAASAWEISVKHALGKLPLPAAPEVFVPQQRSQRGIWSLEIAEAATLRLAALPALHRDPFDRILVCQAIEHAMTLVTPDPEIRKYSIRTLW